MERDDVIIKWTKEEARNVKIKKRRKDEEMERKRREGNVSEWCGETTVEYKKRKSTRGKRKLRKVEGRKMKGRRGNRTEERREGEWKVKGGDTRVWCMRRKKINLW